MRKRDPEVTTTLRLEIDGPDNYAVVEVSGWAENYWGIQECIKDSLVPAAMRAFFGYSLEDESDDDEEPKQAQEDLREWSG